MTEEYIEIKRTFCELSLKGGAGDEFDYRSLRFGNRLGWPELIGRYRTIILAEAGAGKTEEIRHSTQTLRNEAKQAFFLRLENIADDFEIAFEIGTFEEFNLWLSSEEEGWLFLDSVDEARLRDPKDFEKAVRKIGARLSTALQRTHIFVTSRGAAWRPVTDLKLCQQQLRYTVPKATSSKEISVDGREDDSEGGGSPFLIVSLNDLDAQQIELFATARAVPDPKPFMAAIERADAWSLATRPDDLNELVEYWVKHKRIGDRLELMKSSIERRLKERDQDRAEAQPLSANDAAIGARSIAAAATLTQESAIRVPDGSKSTKGIAVEALLPGWDSKKIAALLSRPIFDKEIYETVRFHHRTVREYLTADWLNGLLTHETSRRKIEAILFRQQYGQEVIVPTMRPILVWLILMDDKIRKRALTISPELIFEGGEPKALPLETRQTILRQVCEAMATDITRSSTSDYRAVQRFAEKDIAEDVKELLTKYKSNDDLLWFLLRMVWQGELVEALPLAKQIGINPKSAQFVRISAFRAVGAIGSDTDKIEVRARFLDEASNLNRELFTELLDGLPPTKESVDWVIACLKRLSAKEPYRIDRLPQALDAFVLDLEVDLMAEMLIGLSVLLGKPPLIERWLCEISERYSWLVQSAAKAVERLIIARHPVALLMPTLSVLKKLPTAQFYGDWDLHDFQTRHPGLVPAWQELNDALFWYEVSQARRSRLKLQNEPVTDVRLVSTFGSLWQFRLEDFERVLLEIKSRKTIEDRLVALSLAFRLYLEASRPRKMLAALEAAVDGTPSLMAALQTHLHPARPSQDQRLVARSATEYQRQRQIADAASEKEKQQWRDDLAANVGLLREPRLADPTMVSHRQLYLHSRMGELDRQLSRWTDGHWQALEPEFGIEIARAYRDGVVAYWRRYRPKLRSEGRAPSGPPVHVTFGLTGLSIEARETENWGSTLCLADAEIAFRYAMWELTGFPKWMPELFRTFPDAIAKLLLTEVDRDLRVEKLKIESFYALYNVSWSGSWAWEKIGEAIFERLERREPKNLGNLDHILVIIQGAGIAPAKLAELAAVRSKDRRHAHAARWYAVWAHAEPREAIPALAERLISIRLPAQQTKFAMLFITQLLGGRLNRAIGGIGFRTPENLKNLYSLMLKYVREKEDIQRAGKGAYSPGLRDDAQDARNQLFSLLKEIPGKEAYLALAELAQIHPEPKFRLWMLHHAKTKAELDADLTPWTLSQVLEFQTLIERTPTNHRELFELAELHLLDLKDHLELSDSSIADVLRKGVTVENEMRNYIGDWCRQQAQGRYSIPQEEELADKKRPDLRFQGCGFDGPVPCELKLAHKWSGPEHFERLENQLCGDYLRDTRSSRGLFVLIYQGVAQKWQLPNSRTQVDFTGLISALQDHCKAIYNNFPGVDEVRVVGIDLTRRFQ